MTNEKNEPSAIRKGAARVANLTASTGGNLISFFLGGGDAGAFGAAGSVMGGELSNLILGRVEDRKTNRAERLLLLAAEECQLIGLNGAMVLNAEYRESEEGLYEIVENILSVAFDSYEERKIPHLAKFLGKVPYLRMEVGESHSLVRLFESLSWRQLLLLGAIHLSDRTARDDLENRSLSMQTFSSYTMMYQRSGIRRFLTSERIARWEHSGWKYEVGNLQREDLLTSKIYQNAHLIEPTNLGKQVTMLFGLSEIKKSELIKVIWEIMKEANGVTLEFLMEHHGLDHLSEHE